MTQLTHNGFVAVIGRPNVGKSTLLNALSGNKASIVSRRCQTTRSVVRAICHLDSANLALLDTPGWQTRHDDNFNRMLNGGAEWAASVADVIIFVATALSWTTADSRLLSRLPEGKTVIAAVNKTDLLDNKNLLLPYLEELSKRYDFSALIPISAKRCYGTTELATAVSAELLKTAQCFEYDNEGDKEFMFAELLREKIFRLLGKELPYQIGVVVHSKQESNDILYINADIYVEKESQKIIIIGSSGAMIKKISSWAREDMEIFCGQRIFLETRVRVRAWRNDKNLLTAMRVGSGNI